MPPARHRLLWIDARTCRDRPSAGVAAQRLFDVVPTALDRPLDPAAAYDGSAAVLVVEVDGARAARLDALRGAVAGALDAPPLPEAASARLPRRPPSTASAVAYIEANLAGRVSLDGAARACRLSACELSRRFRQEQRETFSAYVLRRRIERARDLLATGDRPVSQVAYAVGFNDLSYFARVFRRMVGMPATEYVARTAPPSTAHPA
jgi:AraC-like DNA-binding protein